MERQRSFSFKPTRILLFTFTIFSSILFLSTFTIWLTKSTTIPSPLHHHQILLHFNTSSPLTVHSLTTFTKNNLTLTKTPTLIDNRLSRSQKSFTGSKSEAIEHHRVVASNANFSSMHGNGTKVKEVGLVGKSQVSVFMKIEQKEKIVKGCDLTKGYWVFDESYPLYNRDSCPFIDEGFDCEGNGRLDRNFSMWRWQPQGCDLPRYSQISLFWIFYFYFLVEN